MLARALEVAGLAPGALAQAPGVPALALGGWAQDDLAEQVPGAELWDLGNKD